MTYFSKMPYLAYTLDSGKTYNVVSDVLRRIAVNEQTKENYSLYEEYTVQDGETPETVSFKYYNDPQYHWVILLLNDIIDPRFDWPLTETQLYDYVNNKYSGNISGVNNYTITQDSDIFVDPTQAIEYTTETLYPYADAYAYTNIQYESKLNEEKRTIKVLKPAYLSAFVSEYEALING